MYLDTEVPSVVTNFHGQRVELNDAQRRVLATLASHGPMTDMELGYAYRLTHDELDQAWSGLRTRRNELVKLGCVRPAGSKVVMGKRQSRTVVVWEGCL